MEPGIILLVKGLGQHRCHLRPRARQAQPQVGVDTERIGLVGPRVRRVWVVTNVTAARSMIARCKAVIDT